ncbi:TPA: glycosyltransferase [Streptococcus suis]
MIDIVFVILNFNIVDETIECIESIEQNLDTDSFRIIVVDNGSERKIVNKLREKLENYCKVELIISNDNLGFAKGNNIGIQASQIYHPKFVACINNDTLLQQKNFFQILEAKYNQYSSAIIGPKILLKDGSEQHRTAKPLSIESYKKLIQKFESHSDDMKTRIFERLKQIKFIRFSYDRLFSKTRNGREKYYSEIENVILHGCFLIFTPKFFTHLNGFNERTFLYMEEEFLYIDTRMNGLTTLYTPDLWIRHLEDVSTDAILSNYAEKRAFVKKHHLQSLKSLVKYMEDNTEQIKGVL